MEEIGYKAWALIPTDPDPRTGQASFYNPPMLTSVAVDRGASLLFQLNPPPDSLQIAVETTSFSAEDQSLDLFQVYTGQTDDAFAPVSDTGWEKSIEGMYVSFSTQISDTQTYLKLLCNTRHSLVVNRISFYR